MTTQELLNAQRLLAQYRQRDGVVYAPPAAPGDVSWLARLAPTPALPQGEREQEREQERVSVMRERMAHHGGVALAAMRAGQSSHYQLWLLLRFLDGDGAGRVERAAVELHLTSGFSKHHLYNPARLRQLLAEGEGLYWTCSRANIFYAATPLLAHRLGMGRLEGRFVWMTAAQAKASAATFRAWCFAAWLANHRNPITQETIEALTGISPRTQRRYGRLAGIETVNNVAIGPRYTAEAAREQLWQRGQVFEFTDHKGRQGAAGRSYCAWHLPNGYATCVETVNRSKQRSANKRLNNLMNNGARGNGQAFEGHTRLFYDNGAQAAQGQRDGEQECYWRGARARTGTVLWRVMGGQS